MHIGEKVSGRRRKKNWTQEDLAREAGVPQSVISRIERGERKNPSIDVVRRLAEALGVTIDYLAGAYEEAEDTAFVATAVA